MCYLFCLRYVTAYRENRGTTRLGPKEVSCSRVLDKGLGKVDTAMADNSHCRLLSNSCILPSVLLNYKQL